MAEKETETNKNAAGKPLKPAASAKPAATTAKTTSAAKPAEVKAVKPETATKPAATAKPAASKPLAASKPAAAKPTEPKPSATLKKTASEPAATSSAKPAAKAKPAATTAKNAAAKPAAVKPEPDTVKPSAAKPAATAVKPAEAKTSKTVKPAATVKADDISIKTVAAETAATNSKSKASVAEKPSDTPEESRSKPAKKSGGSGISLTAVQKDRLIFYGIIGLALIMVFCLIIGIVFGSRSCTGMNWVLGQDPVTVNSYKQTTSVGYSSQTVGTVARNKPVDEIRDERDLFPLGIDVADDARYPKFGYTMGSVVGADDDGSKAAARAKLIQESSYLTATGTSNAGGGGYTWMDENGYLYSGTRAEPSPACYPDSTTQRQLYKHTASVGLWLGDVSDDEPGIVKQVVLRPRGYSSYSVTGVYAPAGEVIKIEISDADMTATGGIVIHIGQALYNGQANNIWVEKGQMQRIPHLLNTMSVNKNTAYYDESTKMWTAYVGSFIGGPLYVRNTLSTVNVKISGGVAYRHFILGYTSPEEYAELSKSSAPYFDLEVWDRGVLHSGPLTYAKPFSYDDLYKAAVLWEKISIVANNNGDSTPGNQGIVFLYEPFVAAGAAVAFPGRRSVNCPMGWMSGSLNYKSFVTSGSWGNMHEYHHNFQNYGVGYTGEVTNNGLNLVAYSLFTNISSARQIASYGGAGLSGWNCYTSATWAQQQVKTGTTSSTNGLTVYATLLHNLGQENFLNTRGFSGVGYWNRWQTVTHQDFSYFDINTSFYSGGPLRPAATDYPLFVPVSSVYQTGRTYMYDGEKREINTMQPYVIPYGQPFTVDLRPYTMHLDSNGNSTGQYNYGSIILGASNRNDFTYKIKGVKTDGVNGTFVKAGEDGLYTFTPNGEIRSGKIYVTLEIYNAADNTRTWNGHELQDVDLILEFQQSREWNKAILERTTYVYADGNVPASASEAYESGYAGNINAITADNKNYSQNSNTDIWLYPYNDTYLNNPEYSPYVMTPNSVVEIKGKLYFPEAGTYRIYLRGRRDCVLYISTDNGKTYEKAAYIDATVNPGNGAGFFPTNEKTYKDVTVKAEDWIYFKEVVVIKDLGGKTSFVGLGLNSWTVPMYTAEVKYYAVINDNKTYLIEEVIDGETLYYYSQGGVKHYVDNDEVKTETIYKDSAGHIVSAEEASNVTPIPPTGAKYATAYRQDYEFSREFESDYFIKRTYDYNYTDNVQHKEGQSVVDTDYTAQKCWSGNWEQYNAAHLVDGNRSTYIHTKDGWGTKEDKPIYFVVDLGEVKTVNRMIMYSRTDYSPVADFLLEGSLDGENFFTVGDFKEVPRVGSASTVNFEDTEFRYYRITLKRSLSNLAIISEIEMWRVFEINGGKHYSPDNDMFTYKGEWKLENCSASFGHVYVGKDATVEFKFSGTRLGIISSKYFGKDYLVYIDGVLVETIAVKEDNGDFALAYLTPGLEEGEHSVVIYCPKEGNIDSVVIW